MAGPVESGREGQQRKPLEPLLRPFTRAYGIVSAGLVLISIIAAISQDLHSHRFPWAWIVLGLAALLVAFVWSAYEFMAERDRAIAERDAAPRTISAGAGAHGGNISGGIGGRGGGA